MEDFKIEPPEGYEAYLKDNTLKFRQVVVEPEKPKVIKFDDLDEIIGYYIDSNSNIMRGESHTIRFNRNVFPTEEHCKAILALNQLWHIAAHENYNGQYMHDWVKDGIDGVGYNRILKKFELINCGIYRTPLMFKTQEIAEKFIKDQKELLETAKMLL